MRGSITHTVFSEIDVPGQAREQKCCKNLLRWSFCGQIMESKKQADSGERWGRNRNNMQAGHGVTAW